MICVLGVGKDLIVGVERMWEVNLVYDRGEVRKGRGFFVYM